MGMKTYVFWCIIMTLMALAVGTMAGVFVMALNMYEGNGQIVTTGVGNAFCAGIAMTFVASHLFAIVGVSVDKIDSKRNKNEENEEDKN